MHRILCHLKPFPGYARSIMASSGHRTKAGQMRKVSARRATRLGVEWLESRVVLFSNGAASFFGLDPLRLGPAIHEAITHSALDDIIRPEIVDAIIGNESLDPSTTTGNVGVDVRDVLKSSEYDPAHHFDGSDFTGGADYINNNYDSIINQINDILNQGDSAAFDSNAPGSLTDLFGQITHTAQDFYAHANWVENIRAGNISGDSSLLVDAGTGQWNLTTYTPVNGVVLVQGAPPSGVSLGPHDGNYAAGTNPDFLVDVDINGQVYHGIVSGTYYANDTLTPSAVAVSHNDDVRPITVYNPLNHQTTLTNVIISSGLNKDRPTFYDYNHDSARVANYGIDYNEAFNLAVEQTQHEFIRLLDLVADPKNGAGQDALDSLLCAWVKPEAMDEVKAMIGDTTINPPPGPVTIQYSDPPTLIPLGDCVHKGDTISIQATLFSNDPGDDAEGEPLIIFGTEPDGTTKVGQSVSIGTHNQPHGVSLVAQVDDEELFAYIENGEGDEVAKVSTKVSSEPTSSLTPDQSNTITDSSTQLNLGSTLMATAASRSAGSNVTIVSTPTGNVVNVGGSSITSAAAAAAGFGLLAALQLRESAALNTLAISQADTNVTSVPQPSTIVFTLAAPTIGTSSIQAIDVVTAAATPGVNPGLIAAFNALSLNMSQGIGVADALHTAMDRAASAAAAGNGAAETQQELAIRQYSVQLATLLSQQPPLRTQLQNTLQSLGISRAIARSDVRGFEQNVASQGLPNEIAQILRLSGASSATINTIKQVAIVQAARDVAGTLPDKLTAPGLITALQSAAAALVASTATDLAVSVSKSVTGVMIGGPVGYNITVSNKGPLAITGAILTDTFAQSLTSVSWITSSFGGATAPPSGTGDIKAAVDLSRGASVTFTVAATLSSPAAGTLVDTATVAAPEGVTDPVASNNTVTTSDPVLPNPSLKPPQLDPIGDQSVAEGSTLIVTPYTTDLNSPSGVLTFSLDPGAPSGAKIDPLTGIVSWTPATSPVTALVTIRVIEDGVSSLSASRTFPVNVFNIAPTVIAGPDATIISGTTLVRTGSFRDPGTADSWSATVDYGDGTLSQPLALNPDKTFFLAHQYARPGAYFMTVTVTDQGGGIGSARFAVTVTAPPATGPPSSGFGAGHDAFVSTLYREVLNRQPEPAGLRFWSRLLAKKVRRKTVATAIWGSREHRTLIREHLALPVSFQRSFHDALRRT